MPQSSGMIPSSEAPPRPENDGDQVSPKKKSCQGYCEKKLLASNSIDRTMPTVVRIAIVEANIKSASSTASTMLRARNNALVRDTAKASPITDTPITTMVIHIAKLEPSAR